MDDRPQPRIERRRLSHVDRGGRPRMVDVSDKTPTARRAVAEGAIAMGAAAFRLVKANRVAKGDVLRVAELAGIGGAKRTADLIPLCHPLVLDHVAVRATLERLDAAHHSRVFVHDVLTACCNVRRQFALAFLKQLHTHIAQRLHAEQPRASFALAPARVVFA